MTDTTPSPIIGIDLGTTNSVVAFLKDGVPTLIPIGSQAILPSVVGLSPQKEVLVGVAARNQWAVSPENTVKSIKRKMGSQETVCMGEQEYTPPEISAFILKEMKRIAEAHLKVPVTRCVVTVPAYFNELQRQATMEAVKIAGMEALRVLNEPTAAALAYGLEELESSKVLVYDLGGGTFDVSLIELHSGVVNVLATAGNNHLGGDDFDELLAESMAQTFEEEYGIDLRENASAWRRLIQAAEEAKITLSSDTHTTVSLEYITTSADGVPLHIRQTLSRDEFESLIEEKLAETVSLVQQTLKDAEVEMAEVDQILLVGGSTRIPRVRETLREHFFKVPSGAVDPDTIVALGAAVQGGLIAGEAIHAILVDVTPYSLGIEATMMGITGSLQHGIFSRLIDRNTTIPVEISKDFSTLYPGQTQLAIKVYQGEHELVEQNVLLGEFLMEDLKPNTPYGLTDVTVSFHLDISGILEVTVTDRKHRKQVSRQLKATHHLMSVTDIARSQAKIEALSTLEQPAMLLPDVLPAILDEEGQAILRKAQGILTSDTVETDTAEQLMELISQILEAVANQESWEEAMEQLVDLLFDLESREEQQSDIEVASTP